MRHSLLWLILLLAGLGVSGCGRPTAQANLRESADSGRERQGPTGFVLTSAAFVDGQAIPKKYTADGAGISPPLHWIRPPAGTKEFALVVRDPDAPGGAYIHWVLYALPPDLTDIRENVPTSDTVPSLRNARQGINSADKVGYTPPAPPPGKVHHYVFTLYALNKAVDLPAKATEQQVSKAIEGHILDETRTVGTYRR